VQWDGSLWAKDGYFDNGYFGGILESNEGHIGGWEITKTGLIKEGTVIGLYSEGKLVLGAGNYSTIIDSNGMHISKIEVYTQESILGGSVSEAGPMGFIGGANSGLPG
jgi:hypothetical protein